MWRSLLNSRLFPHSRLLRRQSTFAEKSTIEKILTNVPETKVSKLPNQIRVATETRSAETLTVGVWIETGSRFDTEEKSGLAHFLEHMAFKGTKKRSIHKMELEVENIGGHLNAYTSREITAFYAKVQKKDAETAIEIIADILQNPLMKSSDVNLERYTILKEMEEVEKQTEEHIFDILHEITYRGSDLGRTILGPTEIINKISREDLLGFIKTHYTGPRMVVASAGPLEHETIKEYASKHFGQISPKNHPTKTTNSVFHSGDKVINSKLAPFPHMVIGFEGTSWTDPRFYSFLALQTLLGTWERSMGGNSFLQSPLSRRLHSVDICNSFTTFNTCYKETGLFGIYAVGSSSESLLTLYNIIEEELHNMADKLTDEDVDITKKKLASNLLTQLDGTTPICEDIGRQIVTYGRRMYPFELYSRAQAIDKNSIRQCLKDVLKKPPSRVAYGNVESFVFPQWNPTV